MGKHRQHVNHVKDAIPVRALVSRERLTTAVGRQQSPSRYQATDDVPVVRRINVTGGKEPATSPVGVDSEDCGATTPDSRRSRGLGVRASATRAFAACL